ncbi:MAG TPA: hypothetical protein VIA07_05115, partial [Desulfuromonadales bacterium]
AREDEKPVSRPAMMARKRRRILFTVGRHAGGNQEPVAVFLYGFAWNSGEKLNAFKILRHGAGVKTLRP